VSTCTTFFSWESRKIGYIWIRSRVRWRNN
jgi:hypothetical protein